MTKSAEERAIRDVRRATREELVELGRRSADHRARVQAELDRRLEKYRRQHLAVMFEIDNEL